MNPTLDDLNPAVRRQVEAKLRAEDESKAKTMAEAFKPLAEVAKPMPEAELQAACERMLMHEGYFRLTEKNILMAKVNTPQGWFAHFPQAVGNPLMPDLIVWTLDMRRTLMVELKTRSKFSKAQKVMCTLRWWKLAWSEQEFSEYLKEWEATK